MSALSAFAAAGGSEENPFLLGTVVTYTALNTGTVLLDGVTTPVSVIFDPSIGVPVTNTTRVICIKIGKRLYAIAATNAPNFMQTGTGSVTTVTAGTVASATITYPFAFPSGVTPRVVVSANSASPLQIAVSRSAVTNTNFLASAVRTASTGAVLFDWIATTA